MYLSDLIRNVVTEELRKTCVGKYVRGTDIEGYDFTIKCKDAEFVDDDGNCWVKFTSEYDQEFYVDGQGIDIYFEIEQEYHE